MEEGSEVPITRARRLAVQSERSSQPVTRVDTPHDRAADTPHYNALEDARDGGRRAPRRRPAPAHVAGPGAATVSAASSPRPSRDDLRGTRLNVLA